jgi:SagB-type dehydrogenase family enzyme
MTRYLSRVWDDPQCGKLNNETHRLFAYHQATKHTIQSVHTSAHYLDWDNQPNPFRTYEGAPIIPLPPEPGFPSVGTFAAMGLLSARTSAAHDDDPDDPTRPLLDKLWLSQLLWHSMAISARKRVPHADYHYSLRVNPSSGNLHPTEAYLALRGFADLNDGLYHYRADLHALELLSPCAHTKRLVHDLAIPWAAESPLIIGLTSIFWREAWKYRNRAYRYCCHDMGHAMMSLLLAARALGLSGGAITHFADSRLTSALGLTGGDEAPMAFLVFPSQKAAEDLPSPPEGAFAGIPNDLSSEEVPYELLLGIHCATILPDPLGPPPLLPRPHGEPALNASESTPEPQRDALLGVIARQRRSALDFDPRTPPFERAQVEQLLDFATRDWPTDWRGNFPSPMPQVGQTPDYVTLYLYVHRVLGCEPGLYRWDRKNRRLEQLHPQNVERLAAYLSLEQPLAGNACFAVSMVADLALAARVFGNRGYRYVHFEAGSIGQRLYLGAGALNWSGTGIGAFYDDEVHRYLGFLDEESSPVDDSLNAAEHSALVMLGSPASRHAATPSSDALHHYAPSHGSDGGQSYKKPQDSSLLPKQVIYHFAIGRAIPDPRLEG